MSSSSTSYRLAYAYDAVRISEPAVTYKFDRPMRERTAIMDRVVKGIHGNDAFSAENVAADLVAALAKRNRS